jgi:phage terminase large subunit
VTTREKIHLNDLLLFSPKQEEARKAALADLRNRLRWPGITDIRFLGATNPGGIGHSWVKKRWLDRLFDDNETEAHEFVYVRALAQDNPHIDKSYLKQLESLPADKRKAFLEGDWDIFKGQFFTEWRRELHICAPFQIPEDWRKFCALDYGYRHALKLRRRF